MRKIILFILFFSVIHAAHAQVVAVRQVSGSMGKDTLIGNTIWAYTVGEPVIDTYTGGALSFTQGFHQPDGYFISSFIPLINNLGIYPNPGKPNSSLYFYLRADKPTLDILIYDAQGKLYSKQSLSSYAGQTIHSLNPQIMGAGVYTFKIIIGKTIYTGKYVVVN